MKFGELKLDKTFTLSKKTPKDREKAIYKKISADEAKIVHSELTYGLKLSEDWEVFPTRLQK